MSILSFRGPVTARRPLQMGALATTLSTKHIPLGSFLRPTLCLSCISMIFDRSVYKLVIYTNRYSLILLSDLSAIFSKVSTYMKYSIRTSKRFQNGLQIACFFQSFKNPKHSSLSIRET